MRKFQETFETRKRSFNSAFSICVTVPLAIFRPPHTRQKLFLTITDNSYELSIQMKFYLTEFELTYSFCGPLFCLFYARSRVHVPYEISALKTYYLTEFDFPFCFCGPLCRGGPMWGGGPMCLGEPGSPLGGYSLQPPWFICWGGRSYGLTSGRWRGGIPYGSGGCWGGPGGPYGPGGPPCCCMNWGRGLKLNFLKKSQGKTYTNIIKKLSS